MNQPLGYLKEVLSNYTERTHIAQSIYEIIKQYDFTTEEEFVSKLSNEQINFLDKILPDEINHAMEVQDEVRVAQLNEVFELLY